MEFYETGGQRIMRYFLENENLKAEIESFGAERPYTNAVEAGKVWEQEFRIMIL